LLAPEFYKPPLAVFLFIFVQRGEEPAGLPGARAPAQTIFLSSRAKRSNPVNYARAHARDFIIHWIATVAQLPRDDKELVINVSLGLITLCVSSYLFKLR